MRFIAALTLIVAVGVLGLSLTPIASAATSEEISKVQKSLIDKGYDAGPVDGVLGSRTRAGIRQYQAAEKLTVTGRLDAETAGKLGVGPESIGGSFKDAGKEVGQGGKELGHEMQQGKPISRRQRIRHRSRSRGQGRRERRQEGRNHRQRPRGTGKAVET